MKQIFTISNQLIALGKRLAMVLTMLLIVGIGQVWGETIEISCPTLQCKTTATEISAGAPVTYMFSGNSNTYNPLRWYSGVNLTIKANDGYSITGIIITASGSYSLSNINIQSGGGNISNGVWEGESQTVVLQHKTSNSAQTRITKIAVTYTASSGGGDSGDGNTGGSGGDGKCTWELVTDASTLKAGDRVVIAAKDYNYAMSTDQKSNNRGQASITKNNSNITLGNDVQILTLSDGKSAGTLVFNTGSGYLYAASSDNNYLRTENTLSDNSSWTITIAADGTATIVAQGLNTRNTMQYNQSSSLFACYSSASQKALVIYKEVCTKETTVTLNPNGGSGTMDNVTTENGTLTLSECTFTRDGYTFAGWAISEEGEAIYEDKDVIDNWDANNTTLYAQWTPIEYQIIYEGLEGATNGDNPNAYTVESETITFEEPGERVGYTFKGWEPEIIEAGSTGNVTIIATWEEIVLSNNCKWVETEIGEIEPEDEVVVTMTNGVTTWALDQDYYKSGDKYPLATTLEVSGNEITQIYDKIKWNISGNATEGYILYPNGQTNTWLYCTGSSNTIKIGGGSPKHFVIENGYLKSKSKVTTSGLEVDAFLGVSTSTNSWRHYPNTTTSVISGQTLKFYKKTCLMSNEFWIDYELANVTCTHTPPIRRLLKPAKPAR